MKKGPAFFVGRFPENTLRPRARENLVQKRETLLNAFPIQAWRAASGYSVWGASTLTGVDCAPVRGRVPTPGLRYCVSLDILS